MMTLNRKGLSLLTLFIFVFLLLHSSYPLYSNTDEDNNQFLREGMRLFSEGEYEKAVDELLKAVPLIENRKILSQVYELLSFAVFKLGFTEQCEDYLRKMFETEPGKEIKGAEYEPEFIIIYNKVKAEYWYGLQTKSEEEEEKEQKIIEKLAHKPKKKKNMLVRILVIAGVVAILGVVTAVLLGTSDKNKDPEIATKGSLRIINLTNFTVWLSFADINDMMLPLQSKSYTLDIGVYAITFYDDTHSITQTFEIFPQFETRLYFFGWEDSVKVKSEKIRVD